MSWQMFWRKWVRLHGRPGGFVDLMWMFDNYCWQNRGADERG